MDKDIKVLIYEKNGQLVYELDGDPLKITAATITIACTSMYSYFNSSITPERLKEVLVKQIEGAVDIMSEHGEFQQMAFRKVRKKVSMRK